MNDDPLLQAFFEEAAELLADAEAALLELEQRPGDRDLLNRIFRCAHTLKGNGAMLGFQEVTRYTHALEDLLELLRSGHRTVTRQVIDVLLASRDVLHGLIGRARGDESENGDARAVLLSLQAIGGLVQGQMEPAAENTVVPPMVEQETEVPTPQLEVAVPAELPRRTAADREETSIRVPIDRIDRLLNLVGELVIAQSIVSQTTTHFQADRLPQLREAVAQMDRFARELHERMMTMRMVPLRPLLGRMSRLVRDVAAAVGKQASLGISGEDTELDKVVIEKIADPLTHLLRNAVDHGLELPEERRLAGKPETGMIQLSAYQQGGSVTIEVCDDGRGIDPERVLSTAHSRGLVSEGAILAKEEILGLLFQPGFSTASAVTELSGRGVGLDVVKRNLESLGGSVAMRSVPGQGTCFQIRLPLTVAVMDTQTVQVADQVYLLPLLSIVESVRPPQGSIHCVGGAGEVIVIRGRSLPLLRLHRMLGLPATSDLAGLVVIVEHEGRLAALLVDDVLGQQQVVIKSLETNYARVVGIAGATILGDGQVALILDVADLLSLAGRRSGAGIGQVA